MKRFLVFFGDTYYPAGGWHDFRWSKDTLEEAKDSLLNESTMYDWWQIVDSQTGVVVEKEKK